MRLYPIPNADAVDNTDGSITFSFTIWDQDSGAQIAGPLTVTTIVNPEFPDIENAVLVALGQFLRTAQSLTRAQAFNLGVQAHTVPSEWQKWGL